MPKFENVINNIVQVSGQEEIDRLKNELKESANDAERLTDRISGLNDQVSSLKEELTNLKDANGFDEMEEKISRFEQTMLQARHEVEAFLEAQKLMSSDGSNYERFAETLEDVENGYMTAAQAVVKFKEEYNLMRGSVTDGGGSIDGDLLSGMLATLKSITATLDEVLKKVNLIQDGNFAMPEAGGAGDIKKSFDALNTAINEMSDDAKDAYEPLTKLVNAMTEYANIDGQKLASISQAFKNMASISDASMSKGTASNLVGLVKQLQSLSDSGSGKPIRFEVSGLNELKVGKSSLSNMAEFLPIVSEKVDPERVKKIFEASPVNGINNLKVSKAALENLAEYLPKITAVNANKLEKIFNVDTSGINGLKVSKASITNVENLARAVEILKENNVDLTLKGDSTQELDKIIDRMQNVSQATEAATSSVNDFEEAIFDVTKSKGLKGDVADALATRAVPKEDIASIVNALDAVDGKIDNVKVNWRNYGKEGRHVTSVILSGLNETGGAFQRIVQFTRDVNEETNEVTWTAQLAQGAENFKMAADEAAASEERLVEIDGRLADVISAKRKAQEQYDAAVAAGVGSTELESMGHLIESYEVLEDAIKSGGVTQNDYALFMSNASSKSRLLTSVLKEQTNAQKELQVETVNSKSAVLELQNAQLTIQSVIDKAVRSGVTEDNDALQALIEMRDWYALLEETITRTGMSQEDYDAALANTNSEIQLYSKQLGFAVQLSKEEAAAAKAAVDVEKSHAAVVRELNSAQQKAYDANKIGVSADDPGIQQLMQYAEELYALDDKLHSTTMTQKEFDAELANLKNRYQEAVTSVQNTTKAVKDQNTHIAKSSKVYEAIAEATKTYADAQSDSNESVRDAYASIAGLKDDLDRAAKSYRTGSMTAEEYEAAVKSTNDALRDHEKTLKDAGYNVDTTNGKFAELIQQLKRFITPLYLARKAWQTLKEMTSVVIELEDAFAQLQIVTGATDQELEEFYKTSAKIASDLGKSITDIAASIEVFSRLGYSLPDATTLAQYATILSNVANVSTDEATTGLTSIIKGYNMHVEQAEHVSDVLITIGQKYAVSAGEMMEAYERSGAALAATNTSFEKSAAIIAAANAAIQNSSTVGTALKTISARIRGSKSDLEELGEDTAELADGFSKYAKELKAITGVDIMVEGTTDQFKDLYDIMNDIAGVWDTLTDTQQARAAEILGGTRQLQVISSIIRNWRDAQNAYVDAQNSAGEAARANSIYMDTTSAHMNQFKAAFQDLSRTVVDSNLLKTFVDLGTGILKALNSVAEFIEKLGGIVPVIGLVASGFAAFVGGPLGLVIAGISALSATIVGFTNHNKALRQEMISAGDAASNESDELLALQTEYENLIKVGASEDEITNARDAIIDKLKAEGSNVDELIGKYRDYRKAIEEATLSRLQEEQATIRGAIGSAREDLDKNNYGNYRGTRRVSWDQNAQRNIDALDLLQEAGYLKGHTTGAKSSTLNYDFDNLSAVEAHEKLHEMMELLINDGNTTNAVYQDLYKLYEQLSEGVDAYNASLGNLADSIASIQYISQEKPTDLDSYARLRENLIAAIQAQDEFKDSTFDISAAVDSFLSKQSGMEEFAAVFANAGDEVVETYQSLINEVQDKNIDLTKTVFGNIDMNNRQTIEWTKGKIAEFARELQSWEYDLDDILGEVSTVMGGSMSFGDVEIAFSPILQTPDGPVLLSKDTVSNYIKSLIDMAMADDNVWANEELFKLDTQGLEIDGQIVKNILADIGDSAIQTGEAMHYVGEYGALAMARQEMTALAQEMYTAVASANELQNAYDGFERVKTVFDDVTNSLKGINDVQALVAEGFAVDVEKAMELAAAYPEILDNATVTADGQLLLNEQTVNSFISTKQGEVNAAIDAKIAELEGDKALLVAKKELAEAQLQMAQQVANGEAELTAAQLQNRLDNSNKVVQALIDMGINEADAYKAVYEAMSKNASIFDGNVANVASDIAANMASASSSMATGFNANVVKMNSGMKVLVGNAHQVADAVSAMGKGQKSGFIGYTDGGGNGQSINTFGRTLTVQGFTGANVSYRANNLQVNGIIKQLETDISGYTSAIAAIEGQIAALNAIRNNANARIAAGPSLGSGGGGRGGSGGGGGGGGGGSGSGSSQKEETWFEKQYKLHQHYLNMDQETTQDFLKWLEKAYKQAYKEGIITLDEYYKYEEEIYKSYQKIKEAAKSTFDSLVDYRVKMLQKDRENQKKSINDQLNDLKEFYNKQKELLQKQASDEKYYDEQSEKRKSVNDIKAQIAQLQYDDSAWAAKRRSELYEQLAGAEKELQDFENDRALEEALDALDNAYNAEEERLNKEIEAIDEILNDPNALYNQALQDIQNNSEDLFKAFLLFNKKYGDGDDETIIKMWEEAFKNSEAYKAIFGSYYKEAPIGNYTGYTAPTPPTNPQPPTSTPAPAPSPAPASKPAASPAPSLSSGSTIQVKRSATHFSPKSGSVRMASFVPGGQYTVYQTSGNEVLIGRGGVYTGWIYRSDIVGYKKGTRNATPGLHRINEEGTEAIFTSGTGDKYRMFTGGEKVLPAKATNFLYEFAMAGAEILDKLKGSASETFSNRGTINQPVTVTMGDIIINGDTNQATVSEVRRAQREQVNDVLKAFNRYQITLYRSAK